MADNIHSIPSMVDGFTPGQRKVLFGVIKRLSNSKMVAAQIADYVASATEYHHGVQSLFDTVIGMTQDFVGSNNTNLLNPSGQFSSRYDGGKSAAAPRYLYTNLHKIARTLYHPDDDAILNYLREEDEPIEPEWYVPILPMVLINGAEGIGTSWSTSIPNYNPKDIADNILRLMDGREIVPMKPWFRGFKGTIEPAGPSEFQCEGIANVTDEGRIKVEELPVHYWTDSFKDHLEDLLDNEESNITIDDFTNNSTDVAVEFTIELTRANLNAAEDTGLLKSFNLTSSILISNLVCFDREGKIKKYGSAEEILQDFYKIRLEYYKKRQEHLIEVLRDECERLYNMSVRALTVEEVADLKKQIDNKLEQLENIQGTAPKTFWRLDIEQFLLEWNDVLEEDAF